MSEKEELLKATINAVKAEIETVLKNPSSEILHEGKRILHEADKHHYRFEGIPTGIRHVETVKHKRTGGDVELLVLEVDGKGVIFETETDLGEEVPTFPVEWENDFILQKQLQKLEWMTDIDADDEDFDSAILDFMFERGWGTDSDELQPAKLPWLNKAQNDAVAKALNRKISFIWGPPGTGKTATLGHIASGFLSAGKRVLFLSNTNRAVDVGLQSLLNALALAGKTHLIPKVTRFGELALQVPELEAIHFETLMAQKLATKAAAAETEEDRKNASINERGELYRFRCVGTTLAKICTSELFNSLQFDAVIVDEASMVNLPYVLIAASRATQHLVFAGDPMQLPPISQTDKEPHRSFLETDIYLFASGAKSPSDLFNWHDEFPAVTTFFDTQYRMSDKLAAVISTVFYEGRLKVREDAETNPDTQANARIFVFDTSKMNPELELDKEGSGFRPLNRTNQGITLGLVQRLIFGSGFRPEDIGIIAPFRHSSRNYWRELRKLGLDGVETGTVHTFQGREKQVILFDTVMTAEKSESGSRRHFTVRPFDERKNGLSVPRLLNVALSRCKDRLVVIADLDHVSQAYHGRFLWDLMDALIRNGSVLREIPR